MSTSILGDFENYLLALNYTKLYANFIKLYLRFCVERNIDFKEILLKDIHTYINSLQNRKLATESINLHIKSIKKFYIFLADNNICDKTDIINKVKIFKVERKIRPYLTIEELNEKIRYASTFKSCSNNFFKTKALFYFVFYTGIRLGEFLNLKRENFDLQNNSAIIKLPTKNGQEKIVFYPDKVKKLLIQYFKEPEKTNAFNISEMQLKRLTITLSDVMGKHFSFHSLRHSFAHMLADKEIDIRIAQKLLGHKSINSTLIYYDPDINQIAKIYKRKIK